MATIQVADKPTLDAIKATVNSIKAAIDKDSYPNVSSGNVTNKGISVTGTGKITLINNVSQSATYRIAIDGITLNAVKFDKANGNTHIFTFENSFSIENGSTGGTVDFYYVLQLED